MLLAKATEAFQEDLDASDEARRYLAGRGFNHDTSVKYRLGYVGKGHPGYEQYLGRISVPSIAAHDRVVSLRFRSLDPNDKAKMLGVEGVPIRLFNVRAIEQSHDTIGITEGEFDAITIEMLGLPCVGVSGANNWMTTKQRHHARLFAGFRKVLIFGDGDEAGQKFARKVYESLSSDTIAIIVPMPPGEDPNSMYQDPGKRTALATMIEENSR